MRLVTISLTEKEYNLILKICREKKLKRHRVIKQAIQEFLEKYERKMNKGESNG